MSPDNTLIWIIAFCLVGSLGAIGLAALYLFIKETLRNALIPCLLSYATGTLLGAAFLGLLRHALDNAPAASILPVTLGGILLFFLMEKIVIWRHCHDQDCESHSAAGLLLLVGDALHNFIDGIAIASAFVASIPIGITTGLAVFAHELPQELGDFAILLHGGYSKRKAFLFNLLSGSTTIPGAIMAYFFLVKLQGFTPYIMAISAASFIYIAIADLIPSLHKRVNNKFATLQVILVFAGVGTIALFHLL